MRSNPCRYARIISCNTFHYAASWWDWIDAAAWIAFDTWASRVFGLDESKFEWAKIESELMEQERLHDLANDSMATTKQVQSHVPGIQFHLERSPINTAACRFLTWNQGK